MKKLTRIQRIMITGFIGFTVFNSLAMYEGQKGDMGYALGFAILALAFVMFLFVGVVLDTLCEDKNKDNETDN
jgi:hypothetical protein